MFASVCSLTKKIFTDLQCPHRKTHRITDYTPAATKRKTRLNVSSPK